MSTERDDLDGLRQHPGWLRFKSHAEKYWIEQMAQHVGLAANEVDDTMALQKLRQVVAAQKAVQQLLCWPEERLRVVTGATEARQSGVRYPDSMSRGGYASSR